LSIGKQLRNNVSLDVPAGITDVAKHSPCIRVTHDGQSNVTQQHVWNYIVINVVKGFVTSSTGSSGDQIVTGVGEPFRGTRDNTAHGIETHGGIGEILERSGKVGNLRYFDKRGISFVLRSQAIVEQVLHQICGKVHSGNKVIRHVRYGKSTIRALNKRRFESVNTYVKSSDMDFKGRHIIIM
jgi:hypothetical protein